MVNNTVFEYFRNNRDKYPIEALKDKAIKAGYPIKDIEDAIVMSAKHDEPKKIITTPTNNNKNYNALYKTTAIFGILFFVTSLGLLNAWIYFGINLAEVFNVYLTLPIILLLGIYYYGFYNLGKEEKQKNLKIASITKIGITILFPLIYLLLRPILQNNTNITGINSGILLTYFLLFTGTTYYLAITLITTGKETRFAKPAGILNLLYAITLTILYLHTMILYLTQGNYSFNNNTLTILYWEYIITAIFATSAYFFETMMLYTKSNE
jgi:hypothetical protein